MGSLTGGIQRILAEMERVILDRIYMAKDKNCASAFGGDRIHVFELVDYIQYIPEQR